MIPDLSAFASQVLGLQMYVARLCFLFFIFLIFFFEKCMLFVVCCLENF